VIVGILSRAAICGLIEQKRRGIVLDQGIECQGADTVMPVRAPRGDEHVPVLQGGQQLIHRFGGLRRVDVVENQVNLRCSQTVWLMISGGTR